MGAESAVIGAAARGTAPAASRDDADDSSSRGDDSPALPQRRQPPLRTATTKRAYDLIQPQTATGNDNSRSGRRRGIGSSTAVRASAWARLIGSTVRIGAILEMVRSTGMAQAVRCPSNSLPVVCF
jgi:hypothetical protein